MGPQTRSPFSYGKSGRVMKAAYIVNMQYLAAVMCSPAAKYLTTYQPNYTITVHWTYIKPDALRVSTIYMAIYRPA